MSAPRRTPKPPGHLQLTSAETPVVRRAIDAYREVKVRGRGPYRGDTADRILDELHPTPARWAELAAYVIEVVEDPGA